MQFHLIVVSIFLKPYVKDHEDSSSRLLEKKGFISMYRRSALVSAFVNILVFFNELANNFYTAR